MSETIAQLAQKNSRNAIQRVEELEKLVPQVISATNNAVQQIQVQLSGAVEILDAVIQALGVETIEKIVTENRTRRADEQNAKTREQIDGLVAQGVLVAGDKVSEQSLVVFKEFNKEGVEQVARLQHVFKQLQEEFKPQLLGAAVGAKVTAATGSSFEVLEIYEIVEAKQPAPSAAVVDAPTQG
jgi:hypothetical protein